MAIDKKLIDQLLTDYKKPEDIIGENGLLKELTKAILERALAGRDDRSSGLREARSGGPPPGQHAQREKPKDLEGRLRRAGAGDSARPQGDVRSQDRGQGTDPLDGLRRQDHLDVCAGHDDAGDPGPPGRDVRDRSLADADFQRDRCGDRGSESCGRTGRWKSCIPSCIWTR